MKTFVKYLVGTAALVLSMGAMGQNEGYATQDLPVGSANNVLGHILCTAAINSNGTRAGGASVASSTSLGVGTYQVIFRPPCQNITARNGWARIVQVDTLTTGSISGVSCTTADRAGNIHGVFVLCTNAAGALVNTSFFLFVLR
jgi:hypothetical protein